MKITLIKPFLRSRFNEPYLHEFDRPRQPLDLAILASLLLEKGHHAKIIDAFVSKIKPENIKNIGYSDLFVIATAGFDRWQCPNLDYSDAIETINELKKVYPMSKVAVIGPHGTVRPKELLSYENIDFVIRGEPEITFMDLVKNLDNPEKVKTGLCYKNGKELVINSMGIFAEDLDKLPMPAYHLLEMEKYEHSMLKNKNFSIVITSRNCPFGCKFCFREMYGKGYRTRSPKFIVEELNLLQNKFNVNSIYFQDLEFCLDKKRIMEICNMIIENSIILEWGCTTRVTSVDEELLKKMKEAGCRFIAYGLETADEEVLNNLNKGITLEKVRDAVRITKNTGIKTVLTYMVGLPKDSKEAQDKSFETCKEIGPDIIGDGVVCIPYPDTPIYNKGRELGIINDDSWKSVYDGIGVIDNAFTKKQVDSIWRRHRRDARIWRYKKEYGNAFFINPKFLTRVLRAIIK